MIVQLLRRGFIVLLAGSTVFFPATVANRIQDVVDRRGLTSSNWGFVIIALYLSTPFWAAYVGRSIVRSRSWERFRTEVAEGVVPFALPPMPGDGNSEAATN